MRARKTASVSRALSREGGYEGRGGYAYEESCKNEAEHPVRHSLGEPSSHNAASHGCCGEERDHGPGLGGDRQGPRDRA